jgi:hypothetical protein
MGDWLPQIPRAGLGLLELINGRASWRERFVFTGEGLGIALFLYLVVVLLLTFINGLTRTSLPGYVDTFYIVLANALPIAVLGLVFLLTRAVLGLKTPAVLFLVPTVHALAYKAAIDFVLALFGPALGLTTLGVLGYLMYRLGRHGLTLNIGLSVAFAALCVLALVLLQLGLYMLSAPPPA